MRHRQRRQPLEEIMDHFKTGYVRWALCLLLTLASSLPAQSIAEKKALFKGADTGLDENLEGFLSQINKELFEIRREIQQIYEQVLELYEKQACPDEYRYLLEAVNQKREYLRQLETKWQEMAAVSNNGDGYGLWHNPETTLEQLIIDYGSQDSVYLIPPQVACIKLSVASNLPIPRAAWSQVLDLILQQNGVGTVNLNPYLKQLFLIKDSPASVQLITNKRCDLDILPPDARIGFLLSPEPSEARRSAAFLQRFINNQTTLLHPLGPDLLLIGPTEELRQLLKLYDFIDANRGEKDYRLIPLFKTQPREMADILSALFDHQQGPELIQTPKGVTLGKGVGQESNGLKIIPLHDNAQALFIVGSKDEVKKAEEVICRVEGQIGGARDRSVFWYAVKHSDPEELADVLSRVYSLMVVSGVSMEEEPGRAPKNEINIVQNRNYPPPPPLPPPLQQQPPATLYGEEGFYQEGGYIVNPAPAEPRAFTESNPNEGRDNFIVDAKTGSIVMVVETDLLPKIKDLLKRLDVAKKMVQIETLLFEKILCRENNFGLNLLRIGEHIASNKNLTGAIFNTVIPHHADECARFNNRGVFEFFMSRKETDSGCPAFDLAYRFLLSQDDVQINCSPSLVTMNKTPATFVVTQDISVNTGVFEVETAKGVTLKDAFTRAQYGITISVKPTVHLQQVDDLAEADDDYVTLETDITFDTIHPGARPDRPDVTRRHITNEVQVVDGETLILGGLRRKVSNDRRESIPFIGELPGLGKLFSLNSIKDNSTEMYVCLTPHIIKDPKEQLQCLRQELLCLRPGDIPYFLKCVEEAHRYEKTRLMEGSMTILFGRPKENYYLSDCCDEAGEYDGS